MQGLTLTKRPFPGALFFSGAALTLVVTLCGGVTAADGVLSAPTGVSATPAVPDGQRVFSVADGMIAYLGEATQWVDVPASRMTIAALRPSIQQAVMAHPDVRLAQEQQTTAGYASREAFAGFCRKCRPRWTVAVGISTASVHLIR